MFRIGEFSKLGKVSVKTLHHWDEVGLLIPAYVDERNGYRYYSVDQLFDLAHIVRLRSIGFSIPAVSDLLAGRGTARLIEEQRAVLRDEQRTVAVRLASLDEYANERNGATMNYQVILRTIPACTVFASEQTIPDYAALNEIMPALGARVAAANPGLECTPDDYCFNTYLDEEHREHDIRVEICQSVVRRGVDGDGIVFKDLPEITAACVMHRGPYEGIGAAYARAMAWVGEHGYQVAGPVRESYLDGIWNCADPLDWRTEIQVPVVEAESA